MYPILTSGGTGRERLVRGLEALCELLDRHLPLMLATDEAFHQETGAGAAARLPAPLHPVPARGRRRRLACAAVDDVVEAADVAFNAVAWTYVHLRGRHDWPAERARDRVVGLVLNGIAATPPGPTRTTKGATMTPSLRGAARPARARRAPDPRAAATRRARRPAVRHLRRQDDDGRLVGRELDAAPAGRRQPARRGLAREPRARRLVLRPARTTLAADFGRVAARVERAILSLGDVGRVHLYRWGDGGAHFHVWFIPRPLGMVEASGMMLPLWEDVLPNVPDEELAAAAERVAAAM